MICVVHAPHIASIFRVIVFTKICRRHDRVASTNN